MNNKKNKNNDNNEILIFGGTNLFRDILIKNNKKHFSSAYTFIENNNKNKQNTFSNLPEIILLYIDESKVKILYDKISKSLKNKIDFIFSHIPLTKNLIDKEFHLFLSKIQEYYIPTHSFINNYDNENDKSFFLIYKGSCYCEKGNDIIYDEGDFIFIEKLFGKKKKKLYTKNFETILLKIDLNCISNDLINSFKEYFLNILNNQLTLRRKYRINKKICQIKSLFYRNKNEEEKQENRKKNINENNNKNIKYIISKKEIPRLKSALISPNLPIRKSLRNKKMNSLTDDSVIYLLNAKHKKLKLNINQNNDKTISTNFSTNSKKQVKNTKFSKINKTNHNTINKLPKKEIFNTSPKIPSQFNNNQSNRIKRNSEIKFDLFGKKIKDSKSIVNIKVFDSNYDYNTVQLNSVRGEYENKNRKMLTPQEKILEVVKIWKDSLKNKNGKFVTEHFKIPLLYKLCDKRKINL